MQAAALSDNIEAHKEPYLKKLAIIYALIAAAMFGAATPVSKKLLAGLDPQQLAGILYVGAALGISPFVLWRHHRTGAPSFPRDSRNRRNLICAIFFGGILGPLLMLIGLNISQSASVSMWLSLEALATAAVAYFLFREHLSRWTWLCNAGVLFAGLLLGYDKGWAGWLGFMCIVGASTAWGFDNNFTALIDGIAPEDCTFWKCLIAGSINLSIGIILKPATFSQAWIWALVVGGLAYGGGTALYVRSAQKIGAARSQMIFASGPFFGVLLAILWLGEKLTTLQCVAGAILVVAISLMFVERHKHEHTHVPMEHDHEHVHGDLHHEHEPAEVKRHSHAHKHEPVTHTHPHWPDLHHRHH